MSIIILNTINDLYALLVGNTITQSPDKYPVGTFEEYYYISTRLGRFNISEELYNYIVTNYYNHNKEFGWSDVMGYKCACNRIKKLSKIC